MRFMSRERETAERLAPGLDERLRAVSLEVLESAESPGLTIFRDCGGPGMLIPEELGGMGGSLVDALHIHRVLGSRSPSLAIAVNMHSCTVTAMPPAESTADLLKAVAGDRLFLASAFAEGNSGASIVAPTMRGTRIPGGWRISGSKKPCSLSRSMDFLTASVMLDTEAGDELALAIIPAASPGIEVRPLGNMAVFGGSETNEVVLTDVDIPTEFVSFFGKTDTLNAALTGAWLTFELLVSACYLGMASGITERVLTEGRGTPSDRVALVGELEAAMAALESVAVAVQEGAADLMTVARALYVRYEAQRTVERTSTLATELLGGVSFMIGNSALMYTACRALAFHPPSRMNIAKALDSFTAGGDLIVT